MTLFADGGGFLLVCGQNLCICIKSLFGPLLLAFHKNDWQKFSPDKCLCLIHSCFLSSSLCTLSILWQSAAIPPFTQSTLSQTSFLSLGSSILRPFITSYRWLSSIHPGVSIP